MGGGEGKASRREDAVLDIVWSEESTRSKSGPLFPLPCITLRAKRLGEDGGVRSVALGERGPHGGWGRGYVGGGRVGGVRRRVCARLSDEDDGEWRWEARRDIWTVSSAYAPGGEGGGGVSGASTKEEGARAQCEDDKEEDGRERQDGDSGQDEHEYGCHRVGGYSSFRGCSVDNFDLGSARWRSYVHTRGRGGVNKSRSRPPGARLTENRFGGEEGMGNSRFTRMEAPRLNLLKTLCALEREMETRLELRVCSVEESVKSGEDVVEHGAGRVKESIRSGGSDSRVTETRSLNSSSENGERRSSKGSQTNMLG